MRNENYEDSSFNSDRYDEKREKFLNQSRRNEPRSYDDYYDQSYRTYRTPTPSQQSSYLQGERPYSDDYNFRHHGMHENPRRHTPYPEQYQNQYQNDLRSHRYHQNSTEYPSEYNKRSGDMESNYYQDRFQKRHGLKSEHQNESHYFDEYDRSTSGHRGKGPKGYSRSDERICEDICEKLMESPYINAEEVEVQVEKGVVHLSGSVENRRIKYFVEDIADSSSGVKEVKNHIRVDKSKDREFHHNIYQNQ